MAACQSRRGSPTWWRSSAAAILAAIDVCTPRIAQPRARKARAAVAALCGRASRARNGSNGTDWRQRHAGCTCGPGRALAADAPRAGAAVRRGGQPMRRQR
eukprot:scaffold1415_cov117-Isochrysis_galbana.AAC.15